MRRTSRRSFSTSRKRSPSSADESHRPVPSRVPAVSFPQKALPVAGLGVMITTQMQPEPSSEFSRSKTPLYILLGAFGLVLVGLGSLYAFRERVALPASPENAEAPLEGTLLLTLTSVTDDIRAADLSFFALDARTGSMRKISGSTISPRFSPDKGEMAFAGPTETGTGIYVLERTTGQVRLISGNELPYHREPMWSPDGKRLAYVATAEAEASHEEIENEHPVERWKIYVTDLSGNERYITDGYAPLFSPDGTKLLLLKNNGLWIYDIESGSPEKHVWSLKGDADDMMKLSMSPDFKKLAWSNHHRQQLILFSIEGKWEEMRLNVISQTLESAVWMSFSPDGAYLALEVFDDVNGVPTNPRIVIRNLSSGEDRVLVSLEGYNVDYLWLTGWEQL